MGKTATQVMMLALALLAAVNGHCDPPPEGVELSRSMAVAMAIRKNPDLRVEAFNTSMAETDAARSRGIYDPLLSASASGGINSAPGDAFFRTRSGTASIGLAQYLPTGGSVTLSPQTGFTNAEFDDPDDDTTDWQSSLGLSLTQPLLRNAGRETTEISITLADSALQETVEQFRFATTDTVFAVITSYNRLYTLHRNREWRRASLDSAQALLEELRGRAKPGPLHGMEIANAEYAIAQRQRDLVEAERNVRDQEAYLRYLVGMEAKTPVLPVDPPSREEPPESEEEAVAAALEYRSDLRQLRSTLKSSQLQERVARHQSLPDLTLTAGGGLTGTGNSFGDSSRQIGEDPGTFWSAGLFFSVPLGNTALENDYRRSRIRTEQVHSQLEALVWRIRNDIESDMRALISARLQMQTADRALQYAEQRLAEYRKNVRAGTTSVPQRRERPALCPQHPD
jgi:outer membrane protein TolC